MSGEHPQTGSMTPYLGGKILRLSEDLKPLPAGTIVFCIVDLGDEFIVRTSEVYWGVQEFSFNSERKRLFEPC